jgi:16S rRNA (cytosine1402-N4)-methyltransferase
MFDTQKFGCAIAALRKEADMTQNEVADRLNLSRQAVSRYECGESFPDISILVQIAELFGISLDTLIAYGDPTAGEAQILRADGTSHVTAADVVNNRTEEQLATILSQYGELDTTWKIAACIARARAVKPITTTAELVAAVAPCTPKKDESKFLTKLFQALRIEVNGEMEALKMALEQSLKVLKPGGRLVVISYHSLEDRIVKNFIRSGNTEGKIEKDFFGRSTTPWSIVTRKAVVPSDREIAENPRSRSAKMRAAEKL